MQLTFVFSNFGAAMGSVVRGEKESVQRIFYFSSDILAYIMGAILCFTVHLYSELILLEVGTLLYLVVGIYFLIFRKDFSVDGSSVGERLDE